MVCVVTSVPYLDPESRSGTVTEFGSERLNMPLRDENECDDNTKGKQNQNAANEEHPEKSQS